MKKVKRLVILIIFLIFTCDVNINISASQLNDNDIIAKAAILIDADSGRILYQKNAFEKLPMASTTKIMTCLLALEKGHPKDVVEFSNYAASMPKVKLGAKSSTKFYLDDLLYSLMLESHNDTAVAIAESVGGSTDQFANMMNERARQIGAKNTNFVTPNGLDAENHYTTAFDLALITREAIKNEKFVKLINTCSHSFKDVDGKCSFTVSNKDSFLSQMEGAFGVKTGFTGKAGYCFVGALKQGNKTLISVVLASGWPPNKTYKWKDTRNLMQYGLKNFEYRVLYSGEKSYKILEVKKGKTKEVDTYIDGNISTLVNDNDVIDYIYDFPDDNCVEAPITEKQKIGTLTIKINNTDFAILDICAKEKVEKIDYQYSFKHIINKILF